LGPLWERYHSECSSYLASTAATRSDAKAQAGVLRGYFGEDFEVAKLTGHRVQQFVAARRAGGIITATGRTTRPVRARTVDADLVLLNTMLRWATTVREPNGERWLKENPLLGIRRPREPNPKRPVATWERFTKTRRAMQELADAAASEAGRDRWIKMELALVLAEATGRRLSAIRQLRWDDIDFERGTIRWRAEQHAKLPKLEGGLWHPYRRKWATERKHLPLSDVAEAGGWKDRGTLLQCYQQPDPDTLLRVMEGGWKLHDPSADPEKRQRKRQPHAG